MEVFRTDDFYIFVKNEYSLWWDRQTGAFIPKSGWDLTDAEDPHCIGVCYGLIGKVEHPSVFDPRLLIIKDCAAVGQVHGNNDVYKIKSIAFLHLNGDNSEVNLHPCSKHKAMPARKVGTSAQFMDIQKNAMSKTLGGLKSAGNAIKNTTQQAAAMAVGSPLRRDAKDKEKFEKQIMEEFHKIFTDTNSFYFSMTCDITSSLQRICDLEKNHAVNVKALWRTVDDRFFWNKHMLTQLIELDNDMCNPWVLPIIQGYIQIEECKVELEQDERSVRTSPKYEIFKLCILSRRSRFRAGTRYKRRGVDEYGECANYVETEQIIAYQHHEVSFVQVRGSVPVYWSQPGYKYRPPPRIDKGDTETKVAFERHFAQEISKYGPVCVINLVDQTGKEKVIWDAYSHHIFEFNSPRVTYVTFDFHEYCRGMHFENVSVLINSIADIIKDMNYCWRDRHGNICSQIGIFRVNCIDCLDRTNVVQTALAKSVMELQFCKLGLISPEGQIPDSIKGTFQLLWANNGDTISKQYAGTNALKGDYTRTGERKFTGLMKDGMNSANRFVKILPKKRNLPEVAEKTIFNSLDSEKNQSESEDANVNLNTTNEPSSRYYLSRFKDAQRQGTIDLMLGNLVQEEIFLDGKPGQNFEEDSAATAEHVKLLIEDCKKMLINNPQLVLGAWGLINADPNTGDPSETEMDSILILTKDSYYIADYDDQLDKVTKYQQVLLSDLTLLESGLPDSGNATLPLFKTAKKYYCIRLNYKVNGVTGYYHMFRSTNLRFFNNMAVVVKNEEEEIESLKAICEAFVVAINIKCGCGSQVSYFHDRKLDRRKSKVVNTGNQGIYLDISGLPQLTRNVSETQLLALKNAGSKALSNVTQQFSKLNRLGSSLKPAKFKKPATFTIGGSSVITGRKPNDTAATSSDSENDEDYSDHSIFQPQQTKSTQPAGTLGYNISDHSTTSSETAAATSRSFIETGVEMTETESSCNSNSGFLASVGIVMAGGDTELATSNSLQSSGGGGGLSQVDSVQLSSVINNVSIQNPEIKIHDELNRKLPPQTLALLRSHSRSTGEVPQQLLLGKSGGNTLHTTDSMGGRRSNSERDVTGILNITQSQSESALRCGGGGGGNNTATSPQMAANVARDLVLSPFSRLAKGMQSLGANLDPRKMSTGSVGGMVVRQITEREYEEHRRLQEKWRGCKTRLVAL